jgi:predicted 3-demethylubiquinone-9 3-methyltransferase (glyoxalase superfamily)
MPRSVTPFLMFQGDASAALDLYTSTFDGARVLTLERYGPGGPGAEGTIRHATFEIAGRTIACIDSPAPHGFTFTPSSSLFVECASEAELDAAFGRLSESGTVLMPPGDYGFSKKFAWLNDRFGVSWQLNLAALPA